MPAYKLLLEFATLDELKLYVAGLAGGDVYKPKMTAETSPEALQPSPTATGNPPAEEKARIAGGGFRKKKVKEETPAPAPAPAPAAAATSVAAEPPPPSEPPIPYKTVQDATMKFNTDFGREKTVALLGEFKVKIATALKPEEYPDYLARVEELTVEYTEQSLA